MRIPVTKSLQLPVPVNPVSQESPTLARNGGWCGSLNPRASADETERGEATSAAGLFRQRLHKWSNRSIRETSVRWRRGALVFAGLSMLLSACGNSSAPLDADPAEEGNAGGTPPDGAARIDIHGHLLPPFYLASLIAHGHLTGGGGIPNPPWTPELAIAFMNLYGISSQVVSISEPGVYYLESEQERVEMAMRINDYIHEELITTRNPLRKGRFGGMAVLPLGSLTASDVRNAANEANRALTGLGLDGVGLYTSYNGVYLGDPALDALMETLNSLDAVVFVHPVTPTVFPETGIPSFVMEFTFDTTRAAVKMLYSGIYRRYPRIRWILPHAGGTIPFLSGRTTMLTLLPPLATNLQNLGINIDLDSAYAPLYFDTALSSEHAPMLATRAVAGVGHILFGTDWPFSAYLYVIPGDPQPHLDETFNEEERRQVESLNVRTLLPALNFR